MEESLADRTMRYRRQIMAICIKLRLPLTVRSTSIQIFDRAAARMLRDDDKMQAVVHAVVVVASKCEEIHGEINALIKKLPGSCKESIFRHETEVFEALEYNFHFPSLYLRMYGVLAILQEKGLIKVGGGAIDMTEVPEGCASEETFIYSGRECVVPCINRLWLSSVQAMDRMLLLDKAPYKEIELVYASLPLPCEVFAGLTFPFDRDNVTELRNICKGLPET